MDDSNHDDSVIPGSPSKSSNRHTVESPPSPFLAGLLQRCPACGKGSMYNGLLALADQCGHCDFDLRAADPGDGPAFFVITILGFLAVGLAAWVEVAYTPSVWIHLAIWPAFILLGSILMLRIFKGWLIAYQVHLKVGGFNDDDA